MTRDEKLLERVHFDAFQTIALGLRAWLWPLIMLLPFFPLIIPVAMVMGVSGALVGGDAAARAGRRS